MLAIIIVNFIIIDESNSGMMVKVRKEGGRCCWCPTHVPQLLTFCTYHPDFQLLAPVTLCPRASEKCQGINTALSQSPDGIGREIL